MKNPIHLYIQSRIEDSASENVKTVSGLSIVLYLPVTADSAADV